VTEAQETATEAGRAQEIGGEQAGGGIGRAAVLIGAITIVSNIVGFGRQLVFAHTVSATCLGTAYATANQVPNIIYDVVLGGALASVLIPVLAGPAARRLGERPGARAGDGAQGSAGAQGSNDTQASQIASAMLSWTVLLLAPVSVIIAVAAGPLATLLLAGAPRCAHAAIVGVSSRMLVVFAPQILLYGLAVVLYGILQAHRRFTAPALAPVLSSVVVISAYLAFVPLSQGYRVLAGLPRSAELMLSVGTTAGVAALVLTALVPALRLRLRLRPTLRFPAGVAPRIRGLAAVGLITLIAQDASVVVVMVLANGEVGQGALVLYNFGWQMFFVPYAVLVVPIATTAFPVLAAAQGARFDETAAASTRAIVLVSWLGAALLAGAAVPAARLFTHHPGDARQLAYTFAAFAPGLVGYGLSTHLSRVLFADARTRVAAVALVAGWLLVIVADLVAVALVPDWWVVPVLGLGNTIGLTVSGLALLGVVRRARGRVALQGTPRAALAGLAGAVVGAAAGATLSSVLPARGFVPNAGLTLLACGCVALVFGAAALALDGGDLRAVLARGRDILPGLRLAGRRPPS
jgi:putative peptidoglycan lipid II flippase